jgi:hypothetical protein
MLNASSADELRDALRPLILRHSRTRDRALERDHWRAAFAETPSRSRPSLSMSEPSLPILLPWPAVPPSIPGHPLQCERRPCH